MEKPVTAEQAYLASVWPQMGDSILSGEVGGTPGHLESDDLLEEVWDQNTFLLLSFYFFLWKYGTEML